jgi:site-specific recombinase XerD
MPLDLVTYTEAAVPILADPTIEQTIASFLDNSKSTATKRSYRSDMRMFTAWCRPRGLSPLPTAPSTVQAHIAWAASQGLSASSIGRRLCAIAYAHKLLKLPSPVRDQITLEELRGLRLMVTPSLMVIRVAEEG